MINTLKIKKALDLIDAYALTAVALKDPEALAGELAFIEKEHAAAQDKMEAYLGAFVVPRSRKRTAYVCCGCGGIYWENHINCDCNIPYMKEYKMAKVTVIAPKPFNEIVQKLKKEKQN